MTSQSVVGSAVRRFLLLSVAALVVLGVATVAVSRHIAREEAVRDARMRSADMAREVAAPRLDAAVRRGDPAALRAIGRALESRIADGSVSHIFVWDVDGRILWADDRSVVGHRFPLPARIRSLAGTRATLVEDDPARAANPGRGSGEKGLVEVYAGGVDADGQPFIFESYIRPQRIETDYRAIVGELLPLTLGMLLLLELVSLPLALSLARRIDRANRVRSGILGRSLAAWHEERRRIAQDLHDTVIQDLSAVSYALPTLLEQLPDDQEAGPTRERGHQMSQLLLDDIRVLRSMMVDLAPSDLDGHGMIGALEQLKGGSEARGVRVELLWDEELQMSTAVAGLVYRIVREALRNVAKHADTDTARVDVRRRGDRVEVRVEDDGVGLGDARPEAGHAGLQLLGQLVQDVGGSLAVFNRDGGGVALVADLPADIDPELEP